jgi:hypothetical protein
MDALETKKVWYLRFHNTIRNFNLGGFEDEVQLRLAVQKALNAKHSQPPALTLIKVALRP